MKNKFFLFISIAFFIAVIGLLIIVSSLYDETKTIEIAEVKHPIVSIVNISASNHKASIIKLAETKPRFDLLLKSQVSGQIITISDSFLAGENIKQGQVLLEIEKTALELQIIEAENRIEQASLNIALEKRNAYLAKEDWKRAKRKGEPDSDLFFYEPQIKAAEMEKKAALKTLEQAKLQLTYSEIKAPFNGKIIYRNVSIGDVIEAGQELGQIVSTDILDITVYLDEKEWNLLDQQQQTALLFNPLTQQTWTAKIRASGDYLDPTTRLRPLYLQYQNNENSLLPNQLLEVILTGRLIKNIFAIPESALTRDGYIWLLDKENRLDRKHVEVVFVDKKNIYIQLDNIDSIQIAVHPLASFVVGNLVAPQEKNYATNY